MKSILDLLSDRLFASLLIVAATLATISNKTEDGTVLAICAVAAALCSLSEKKGVS